MKIPCLHIMLAVLVGSLLVTSTANAGFSYALAKQSHVAVTGEDTPPPFPTGEGCDTATTDAGVLKCTTKAISSAAAYCTFVAGGFSKDQTWWQKARIPILIISVAGTALGVSAISSAKSWAAVGGTSGIASSWNSDSTSVSSADDQRLNSIKDSAGKLANLDLKDLKTYSTAVSVAAQCRAAAGSTSTPAKTDTPPVTKP